jgi:hypothetical protein
LLGDATEKRPHGEDKETDVEHTATSRPTEYKRNTHV